MNRLQKLRVMASALSATDGERENAKRILNKLTGSPPPPKETSKELVVPNREVAKYEESYSCMKCGITERGMPRGWLHGCGVCKTCSDIWNAYDFDLGDRREKLLCGWCLAPLEKGAIAWCLKCQAEHEGFREGAKEIAAIRARNKK